jgi:DNA-binding NtrC family response regulator/tetratricopeptide (TPR) repeat protein
MAPKDFNPMLDPLLPTHPESPGEASTPSLDSAFERIEAGDLDAAQNILATIRGQFYPEDPRLNLALGLLAKKQGDPPRMIHYGQIALQDEAIRSQAMLLVGFGYLSAEEFGQAQRILGQIREDHPVRGERLEALAYQAECLMRSGQGGEAARLIDTFALPDEPEEGEAPTELRWEGEVLLARAKIAWENGDARESKRYCERALRRFQMLTDPERLSEAYANLGRISFFTGHPDLARECLQTASGLRPTEKRQRAFLHWLTGLIAWSDGHREQAKVELRDAIALAESLRDGEMFGLSTLTLGELGLKSGRVEQNENARAALFAEAENILKAVQTPVGKTFSTHFQTRATIHLGRLAVARGEQTRAKVFFEEARRQLSDTMTKGLFRKGLAEYEIEYGESAEALLHLKQAVTSFEKVHYAEEIAECHYLNGIVFSKAPDAEIIERAIPYFRTAIEMFGRIGRVGEKAQAAEALATVERKLGRESAQPSEPESVSDETPKVESFKVLGRILSAANSRELLLETFCTAVQSMTNSGLLVVEWNDSGVRLAAGTGFGPGEVTGMVGHCRNFIQYKKMPPTDLFFRRLLPEDRDTLPQFFVVSDELHLGQSPLYEAAEGIVRTSLENLQLREQLEQVLADERPVEVTLPNTDDMGLIGISPQIRQIREEIRRFADSNNTVLIQGETGTGKEVTARAIHRMSSRRDRHFVAYNCAAVPENLMESQLFGHRKGSFTGADRDYPGVVMEANGGTLFLDEIGELPLTLQAKLLRLLQEQEIHPIGEPRPIRVNVRVIAATHRNLENMTRKRTFREDFYYRLKMLNIYLPALRERREDIPQLAHHFLKIANEEARKTVQFSESAIAALQEHPWPGNIRELQNVIGRAVLYVKEGQLLTPERLFRNKELTKEGPKSPPLPLPQMDACETVMIGLTGKTLEELTAEILEAAVIHAVLKGFEAPGKLAGYLGIGRNTATNYLARFADRIAQARGEITGEKNSTEDV